VSENPQPTPPTPSDLVDSWRRTASDMEQRWNDFLNQAMGTEAFAQTMARSMDGYLAMQANFARAMEQYLRALNIPTCTDLLQLAERIGMLEQRIADLTTALAGRDVGVHAATSFDDPAAEKPPSPAGRRRATRRGKA
jgi:polyhydroxyalkanoate synthesis regulator phasin